MTNTQQHLPKRHFEGAALLLLLLISSPAPCGTFAQPLELSDVSRAQNIVQNGTPSPQAQPGAQSVVMLARFNSEKALLAGRPIASICTGTVVSPEIVVTANHCLTQGSGAFGAIYFRDPASGQMTARGIQRFLVNSQANPANTAANDVALLRFSGGLPRGVRPVDVLDPNTHLNRGARIRAFGFGLLGPNQSNTNYELNSAEGILDGQPQGNLHLKMTQGSRICSGDSGGPIFTQVEGRTYLLGVISSLTNAEPGRNAPTQGCSNLVNAADLRTQLAPDGRGVSWWHDSLKRIQASLTAPVNNNQYSQSASDPRGIYSADTPVVRASYSDTSTPPSKSDAATIFH